MRMYRVTENRNGEIILLAIFKHRDDAVRYIIDELCGALEEEIEFGCGYIEIENNYDIKPIDIENIT